MAEPAAFSAKVEPVLRRILRIFGGVLGRRLTLIAAEKPETDGAVVRLNPTDPALLLTLDSLMATLVFESAPAFRDTFVQDYVARVGVLSAKAEVPIDPKAVEKLLLGIYNLLETRRLASLWTRIYLGSGRALQQGRQRAALQEAQNPKPTLLGELFAYASDVDPVQVRRANGQRWSYPPNRWVTKMPLEMFADDLRAAVARVEGKGPRATALVSRWLMTALLKRLLEEFDPEAFDPPPPQEPQENPDAPPDEKAPPPPPNAPPPPDAPAPPPPSAKDRMEALAKLVEGSGTMPEGAQGAERIPDRLPDPDREKALREALKELNQIPPADEGKLDEELDKDGEDGEAQAEKLRDALRELTQDETIQRSVNERVLFREARTRDLSDETLQRGWELFGEDHETARQLRSMFQRVRGKVRSMLDDVGIEPDIPSVIQRRLTGSDAPVFQRDVRGRGFRCLLLVDLSESMELYWDVVARTYRVLGKAMQGPGIRLEAMGFQALTPGSLDVTRFEVGIPDLRHPKVQLAGGTPLGPALMAVLPGLRPGGDVKQILVLTDGYPHHQDLHGRTYGVTQVRELVATSVQAARRYGISVHGMVIDDPYRSVPVAERTELDRMFGPKGWTLLAGHDLSSALLTTVSGAFVSYLKAG